MALTSTINVANALTVARISLAPLLVFSLLAPGATELALAVFAVGMTSDFLDGHLARSRNLITSFGELMDPIADKLFIGSALACLTVTNRLARGSCWSCSHASSWSPACGSPRAARA